jgi:hypothetical protein
MRAHNTNLDPIQLLHFTLFMKITSSADFFLVSTSKSAKLLNICYIYLVNLCFRVLNSQLLNIKVKLYA